jgi:hypothetical protein
MSVVGPIAAKKLQGRECSEVFLLQQNSVVISIKSSTQTDTSRSPNEIYGMSARKWSHLFCLDVCRPDHLAPLLGLVSDEFPEVGGRARNYRRAQVGEPRLDLGIG